MMEMNDYIARRYEEFYKKNGYLPEFFCPYNGNEIVDYANTLSTECGTPGHMSNILIIEKNDAKNIE